MRWSSWWARTKNTAKVRRNCLVLSYTRTRSIVVAIDPTLAFQTRPVHVQHAAAESLLGGVRSSNKLDVTFAHIARCIARCMMRLR